MIDLFGSLNLELTRIIGALALVIVAAAISYWQKVGLEADMLIAVARAFVQLIAIGYALQLIFDADQPIFILLILLVMLTVAGLTAGNRAGNIPNARPIATAAIGISVFLTLGVLLILQVFELTPQAIIPIGGMVIGNAMTSTGLTMARLRDDMRSSRLEIETALALGASSRVASRRQIRSAILTGMTPIVDSTKTVGLIALPGTMTGLILAGSPPIEAVQIQLIVMYMLIGAAAFASLVSTFLTYRQFFTPAHQLKRLPTS